MGLLDKAKALIRKNENTIDDGLEKAGDFVDDRTKGKHTDTIDKVVTKAQDLTEGDDRPPV